MRGWLAVRREGSKMLSVLGLAVITGETGVRGNEIKSEISSYSLYCPLLQMCSVVTVLHSPE